MSKGEFIDVVLDSYSEIPVALLANEIDGQVSTTIAEISAINKCYRAYKLGAPFATEGSEGDYVPAQLKYKLVNSLINKQARFLFAEAPDIVVEPRGDMAEQGQLPKDAADSINSFVRSALDANNFENKLIKAAKDCFIGKRVAALVNFSEMGIDIQFLKSKQFVFQFDKNERNKLSKFTAFSIVKEDTKTLNREILRKRYEYVDGVVYVEDVILDGIGKEKEVITERTETLLSKIPAVVIINDGLSGDVNGESEVDALFDFDSMFSKLASADIDAQRKGMNEIRYTVDMDQNSTKKLSSAPGAYWDLLSDQNLDKASPQVGKLTSGANYSQALTLTLDRVRSAAFDLLDMPMVTIDAVRGSTATGKALKAIYWPLIVRCKEKMKTWGPALREMVEVIIEGALKYPQAAAPYTADDLVQVDLKVSIIQNQPLPEDEQEERMQDLAEVTSQTMSKKAYMKKWRFLTDEQAEDELRQIAIEKQLIDDHAFGPFDSEWKSAIESIEQEQEQEQVMQV